MRTTKLIQSIFSQAEIGCELYYHNLNSGLWELCKKFTDTSVMQLEKPHKVFTLHDDDQILVLVGLTETLLDQIDNALEVVDSPSLDWETKYNYVFSLRLYTEIRKEGIQFDWYDPDISYKHDVLAYAEALKRIRPELAATYK